MNGFTAAVASRCSARVHVLVGGVAGTGDADAPHDDEAGIDLDALRADIAEHDDGRVRRGRTQAFAEGPGDDVLQHHVDALLAGEPPDFAAEFQIRTDDDFVGARLSDDVGLVLRTGDGDHAARCTLFTTWI